MKLAKLSLAAIVVAGLASSSFAADTLADAFKNGSVNGELKAYYFANKDDSGDKDSLFTTGVLLGYKTASFYGLSLGLTFQGSSSPFADKGAKADYSGYEYGSGAVLSEAYVAYNIGKTTAMVGRMFLDTPLVATSGSKMTKDAFEGAAIINTDLPNTTLIAGYVQKHQDRTTQDFDTNNGTYSDMGKFSKTFGLGSVSARPTLDDGAYTLAAINKSITGLTLTAAYVNAIDVVQIAYIEALYEGKVSELGYTLAGQFYYNKLDSSNVDAGDDDSGNVFGLKAGVSYKGVNGYIAYAKVQDNQYSAGGIISGLGNGADLLYTSPVIGGAYYGVGSESYAADLNYDLTAAANIGTRYVYVDLNDDANTKRAYTSVYGYYKFDAALKGLKLGVEFEDKSKDIDGNDLWVKANYKF